MKPLVCFLVGLPGTGKTTFVESDMIALAGIEMVLSTDYIIEGVAERNQKTYSEVFDTTIDVATKAFEAQLTLLTMMKDTFIIDRTNLTKKGRARLLNLMQNKDEYNKVAVVFKLPTDILKERLTEREKTGKIIPASVMKRMEASTEYPTVDEGFDAVVSIDEFNLDIFFKE